MEYLIGVGARCEANTFDGERCLYGALTDEIRRILTHHNLISAHMIRRDAYDEFLRRLVHMNYLLHWGTLKMLHLK